MVSFINRLCRRFRQLLIHNVQNPLIADRPTFQWLLRLGAYTLNHTNRIGYWNYLHQIGLLYPDLKLKGFSHLNQKLAYDQALTRWVVKNHL